MGSGRESGSVRIIGGTWRGRRLKFPAGTEVRPTPDRVRETVFNWLGPAITGQTCLDLFAGSGAFGFEALSRGAARVVMLERDPKLYAALETARDALGATGCELGLMDARVALGLGRTAAPADAGRAGTRQTDAGQAAARPATRTVLAGQRFWFVTVDPPFRVAVEPILAAVRLLLAPGGSIYVERPADTGLPELDGLRWHRRSRAGRVEFGLAMGS